MKSGPEILHVGGMTAHHEVSPHPLAIDLTRYHLLPPQEKDVLGRKTLVLDLDDTLVTSCEKGSHFSVDLGRRVASVRRILLSHDFRPGLDLDRSVLLCY